MSFERVLGSWAVEAVADLVNSRYTLDGDIMESWPDVEAYRRYLRRNGRDDEVGAVVPDDLPRVRVLRSQVRAVLGIRLEERVAAVDSLLAEHIRGVRLGLDGGGTAFFPVPVDDSHGAMLAARSAYVLALLAEAGELGRLKLCGFDGCDGALVDRTRPGTQRFCCPRCAARVASAAYRQRRRARSGEQTDQPARV